MIIRIPIQSFGDIITNSSSETFCTITSEEKLEDIYKALTAIIGSDGYSEDNICIYKKEDEEKGQEYLRLDVPYDADNYKDFIAAGVEVILDKGFKDSYNIKFV